MIRNWKIKLKEKPLYQAATCLLIAMVIQTTFFISSLLNHKPIDSSEIWSFCPILMLFFILLNIVMGFQNEKINIYYRESIYGFLGFLLLDILFCQLVTGTSISEVKSIKLIVFVFSIVYLVFLSIQNLIRFILALVLKQDKRIQEEAIHQENKK